MKPIHWGAALAVGACAVAAIAVARKQTPVALNAPPIAASSAKADPVDASTVALPATSSVDADSMQDASIDKARSAKACARITEANTARVKEALAAVNRRIALEPANRGLTPLASPPESLKQLPPWDECTLVARGAWGFSLEAIAFDLFGSDVDARWSVAFAGNDGRLFQYAVEGDALMHGTHDDVPNANCCGASEWFTLLPLNLFDFDGDGLEEAYFSRTLTFAWEPEQHVGVILSVTADGIEPYSAADEKTIFAMEDRTGDGRPDLFLHREPSEDCIEDHPEGKCVRVWGPVTALRSLKDGTFIEDKSLE